jgi:uncharacterized alkaline shock family protein YloU
MVEKAQAKTVLSTSVIPTGIATGRTIIADPVVAKIAGIAAREVPGVYSLGGGAARVVGAIRGAMGTTDLGQGVKVDVGETEVAADVTITVEYPMPLHEVSSAVRVAVADAIERLIGMQVAEINVTVSDVHIPGDDDETTTETRVS